MKRNIYANIKTFGESDKPLEVENPLSYCLNWTVDQTFLHGGNSYIYGQYSPECQSFLSDYCAQKWDAFCEIASHNNNISYPNVLDQHLNVTSGLTAGEILIKNAAARKYLISMSSNCVQQFQAFDPMVANSPMISYWGNSGDCTSPCEPRYAVNPVEIDNDPIMNKILDKPSIALDILVNIYETMSQMGTIVHLKGTKLGMFYDLYKRKCQERASYNY